MREFAIEILKKVIAALREERFADLAGCIDESALNAEQVAGFMREALGRDALKLIGGFSEENILYSGSGRGNSFDVVYILGADSERLFAPVIRFGVITGADGSMRTVLNFARTQPNSVILLDDTDRYDAVWNRVYGELGFKPGMRESVPFKIRVPHAVFDIGDMTDEDIDRYEKACGEIFAKVSKGRVYALDWQHSAFLFDPRDLDGRRDFWTVNTKYEGGGYNVYFPSFYPDGDYYFFIDENFEFGLLGHPWRREVWIFGELLLNEFGKICAELRLKSKETYNGKSIQKADY